MPATLLELQVCNFIRSDLLFGYKPTLLLEVKVIFQGYYLDFNQGTIDFRMFRTPLDGYF